MSNEEKKAIESLKKDLDCTVITFCKAGLEDIKIVLNLIEKQSKEIEELKEDRKSYAEEYIHNNPWLYKQLNENYILRVESEQKERKAYIKGTNDTDKLCNKKWEDKIKAEIEEIKNECKYCDFTDEFCQELLQNNNCTQGNTLKILQSLLEKE